MKIHDYVDIMLQLMAFGIFFMNNFITRGNVFVLHSHQDVDLSQRGKVYSIFIVDDVIFILFKSKILRLWFLVIKKTVKRIAFFLLYLFVKIDHTIRSLI